MKIESHPIRRSELLLMFFCSLAATVNSAFAQTWIGQTNAPNHGWNAIASSADGSKLIAGDLNWNYFISTNSGASWVSNSEPQSGSLVGSWYYLASSVDGTKLLGSTVSSAIFVSTNSGMTWLSNNVPGITYWGPVTMSADGNTLYAAAGGNGHPPGYIYVSTNWGVTWNPTSAPTNIWMGIASSADGTKLVAVTGQPGVPFTGAIYTSTNSGTTWTNANAPSKFWYSVASSADGTKLAACYYAESNQVPGHVFTSTDSGNTWVSNSFVSSYFESVSVSADGNTLVVGGQPNNLGDIYVSTNFGATWTSNLLSSDLFAGFVISVASSADGGKLFAATLGGLIYTSQNTPLPQLNIASSDANLALSWTIPSTNFVVQQSSDLISWSNITNMPTLNFTNLQYQVMLSPSNNSDFYRLATP